MKALRLYHNTVLHIGNEYHLNDETSHHLNKVLRFPQGQNITLFNGDGKNYTAEVLANKKQSRVKIIASETNPSESTLHLTLVQGIAKGEKMDFLIQKAVELGVNRIVPIFTERCVVKLNAEKRQKRRQHWQKIVINACQQSGRSVVPEVLSPMDLAAWLLQPVKHGFVCHHRAKQTLLAFDPIDNAQILIGPEGGLSTSEIAQARQANYQPLLLGKRVLRTETASLVAIANMQLLWGS